MEMSMTCCSRDQNLPLIMYLIIFSKISCVSPVYQWEPAWDKLLFCQTDKFGGQFENNMFGILISYQKTL